MMDSNQELKKWKTVSQAAVLITFFVAGTSRRFSRERMGFQGLFISLSRVPIGVEFRVIIQFKSGSSRYVCFALFWVKGKFWPNRNWASQKAHQCRFCIMKRLGVSLLPLDGMLVHHRLPLSILSGCPQSR